MEEYIGYLLLLPIIWFLGSIFIEFFKLIKLWFECKMTDMRKKYGLIVGAINVALPMSADDVLPLDFVIVGSTEEKISLQENSAVECRSVWG